MTLFVLPLSVALSVLMAHKVLVGRLAIYQIDPVRLLGEYYFPIILLAAIGTAEIGERLARASPSETVHGLLAWGVPLIVSAIAVAQSLPTVEFYRPRTNGEPRLLSQAIREYRLDELWHVLRSTPGRVMFTSHYTRFDARGEALNSTVPALTPLYTNRQLMGGTYSHWSPIAALMWVGDPFPPVLHGRIEERDDRTLFGVPLEQLSDEQLYAYCQRFNITTIVASVNDSNARTFLDTSPRFQSFYNNGYFFVYRVKDYENAWLESDNAVVEMDTFADKEIAARVLRADANARVTIKVFAYPLWNARTDDGKVLQISRDEFALMQIALPPGENYRVTISYEEGLVEWVGKVISIASAAFWLGVALIGSIRWARNKIPQRTA